LRNFFSLSQKHQKPFAEKSAKGFRHVHVALTIELNLLWLREAKEASSLAGASVIAGANVVARTAAAIIAATSETNVEQFLQADPRKIKQMSARTATGIATNIVARTAIFGLVAGTAVAVATA
jgi:hypothetical protein